MMTFNNKNNDYNNNDDNNNAFSQSVQVLYNKTIVNLLHIHTEASCVATAALDRLTEV